MNIIIDCECSGRVKEALRKRGHNARSCDLKPSEIENDYYHIQGDIRDQDYSKIDMVIAFPDCTYLTCSGARWNKNNPERLKLQQEAIEFVRWIANLPVPGIAIENPIGILSTVWRKPDQIIQPFWFGEPLMKSTCLWLKGLPKLKPTNIVEPLYHTTPSGRVWSKWFYDTSCLPIEIRSVERSRTFQGIAEAMAEQWGNL